MAVIPPSQYETVAQLRAAVRSGSIREMRGFIVAVKIDGQDIGDTIPRAVQSQITYSVGLAEPGVSIPDQSLTDIVPSSRVGTNLRIIGPPRYSPCTIVVVEIGSGRNLFFFPHITEVSDPRNCDGDPVLEGV